MLPDQPSYPTLGPRPPPTGTGPHVRQLLQTRGHSCPPFLGPPCSGQLSETGHKSLASALPFQAPASSLGLQGPGWRDRRELGCSGNGKVPPEGFLACPTQELGAKVQKETCPWDFPEWSSEADSEPSSAGGTGSIPSMGIQDPACHMQHGQYNFKKLKIKKRKRRAWAGQGGQGVGSCGCCHSVAA